MWKIDLCCVGCITSEEQIETEEPNGKVCKHQKRIINDEIELGCKYRPSHIVAVCDEFACA